MDCYGLNVGVRPMCHETMDICQFMYFIDGYMAKGEKVCK